jgi:hypothetical protein
MTSGFARICYTIGTAPGTGDDILDTLHSDFRAEHTSKEVKFRFAESFTDGSRRADGTVTLDEQETCRALTLHFGHVAFFRPNASHLLPFLVQKGVRGASSRVGRVLPGAAGFKDALHASSDDLEP